jgi:hypothetical protein
MKTLRFLFASLAVAGATVLHAVEAPRTFVFDREGLLAARQSLARGDAGLAVPLAQLRAEADQLLELKPASVMDKPRIAASGNRHDYFSQAPYWWPDPAKPDGLPYLRDDGRLNPDSKAGTDSAAFGRTCRAVETLGLAYWFTSDERYAQKAATLARVWFLDPATRMTPNLQHAQAIPGINDGRGIGIIEARHLIVLADGLALLAGSPAWTTTDEAAMKAWLGDYYHWLTTSQNGRDESKAAGVYAGNNHGSWYDVQVAALALHLGRNDDAKKILAAVPGERIARQIEPDGRQPLELARTKSLNYSFLNLEALVLLARLGETVGLDLWKFSTPDGRSLPAALHYVAPYADPAKVWPQKDLETAERTRLLPLLAEALRHGEDAGHRELFTRCGGQPVPGEHWRLWLQIAH